MGLAGTTISSSILHRKMSGKTTDRGPPIEDPLVCFLKWEFTEKTHSFVNFTYNFLKIDFSQNGFINLST